MQNLTRVLEFRLKLYPDDFDKVRDFYEKLLCYPVIEEWNRGPGERGVMFDVGQGTLELLSPEDDYRPIQGATVSWEVADVMGLWENLKNRVNVEVEPRHNPWGDTSFRITDPEGFKITFFTRDKVSASDTSTTNTQAYET
jgi:catechol 2,3-dioxygenase-like lactoylglutathione lyase family enzyme